jgi:hypothetical protein
VVLRPLSIPAVRSTRALHGQQHHDVQPFAWMPQGLEGLKKLKETHQPNPTALIPGRGGVVMMLARVDQRRPGRAGTLLLAAGPPID